MLKIVPDVDIATTSKSEIRETLLKLNKCTSVADACVIAERYFGLSGHTLISVVFCSHDDSQPAIRAFRNLPDGLTELAQRLPQVGGCPPKKQAQKHLLPFDWKTIPKSDHPDFLSQRFLAEVQKLPYASILAVPVVIGGGIGLFSVAIADKQSVHQAREEVISAVTQIATAMICRFPELSTLFETKILTTIQTTVLLFAMQGLSNAEIARSIGLSETAICLIIKSAQNALGAGNLAQTVAKALAHGEFAYMQMGEHDLI